MDVPIIASLNGVSTGGWIRYAQMIEQAGADALELNVYYMPTDLEMAGVKVEEIYFDLVSHVKASVRIPVAVKLGSFFSSIANIAKQARRSRRGRDRPVQPLLSARLRSGTAGSQAHSDCSAIRTELLLRLHWTAILYNRIRPDLAITGGVHTAEDVVKGVMAGARVTMMTSALLRHGIQYLEKVEEDLIDWMEEHEYESIRQMRGSMSAQSVAEPAAFERANYMKVLSSYALKGATR